MFSSRDAARRAAKDADDVELAALRAGVGVSIPLEEALFDETVSEEAEEQSLYADIAVDPDSASDDVERSILEDSEAESTLANVGTVIEERQRILGDLYPFRRAGNRIEYLGSYGLVYEFCLATVYVENISLRNYRPLQVVFERLSALAMSKLFCGAGFVRSGYPPDSDQDDEPGNIRAVAALLQRRMPDPWVVDENIADEDLKDGGVDAIVFRAIDNRSGSLLFVGNCGCGRNWLKEKKHLERPSDKLERVLSMPKKAHLLDFFSLPFHVVEPKDWAEASHEGRLFLDRLRLALLLEATAAADSPSVADHLRCDLVELINVADHAFQPHIRTR